LRPIKRERYIIVAIANYFIMSEMMEKD
jgi:hypothetical protein